MNALSFRVVASKSLDIFRRFASTLDKTQEKLLSELCILVDEKDTVVGRASKRECHLKKTDTDFGLLHRAFSVFAFNSRGQLLLQKRAKSKITFPGCVTNTCCSHPLYDESEMDEREHIGVRRAAQRRLNYELGIPHDQVPLEELKMLTRIHYRASSDETWAEHEVDYILFLQRDVTLRPNSNEVESCWFASPAEVRDLMFASDVKLSPWFRMISQRFLFEWWENIRDLSKFEDHQNIHQMHEWKFECNSRHAGREGTGSCPVSCWQLTVDTLVQLCVSFRQIRECILLTL